jgi:antitoxin PrlF
MITSKLTGNARTTIPRAVRVALRLQQGDAIAYQIEDGRVIVTKATQLVGCHRFGTFDECNSDADQEAYRTL